MKQETRHLIKRIIAWVLIIAMIPGLLIFNQTGVRYEATTDDNRSIRLAAQQLLRDDSYAQSSRIKRMGAFARNLLRGKRTFEDYQLAAQIAIAQARYDEAAVFLEKAIGLFEGSVADEAKLYLQMGYLFVLLGEYEKSLKWLDLGISVTPYPEAILTRAQVRLNLGDMDGALEDVNVYRKRVGDSDDNLLEMVNIYEAAHDYETAAELWTRILKKNEKIEYLIDRAYCYVELGRMEEAESDARRYLGLSEKNHSTVNAMLGIGFLRTGNYGKANDYFVEALNRSDSEPVSLYYYIVMCAYLTGNHERVVEYGEKLIQKVQQGQETGMAQYKVEDATGKLEVQMVPMDFSKLCQMTGSAYIALGKYARAAEVLTFGIEQNGDFQLNYLRGVCRMAEEKYKEAIEDYSVALRANVEVESVLYSRGVCYMETGDYLKAQQDFGRLTEITGNEALREEAFRQMEIIKERQNAEE